MKVGNPDWLKVFRGNLLLNQDSRGLMTFPLGALMHCKVF